MYFLGPPLPFQPTVSWGHSEGQEAWAHRIEPENAQTDYEGSQSLKTPVPQG